MSVIRSIEDSDLDAVVALMCASFPRRDPLYFRTGLARMAERDVPGGTETWGLMIDDDGPKGAVLAISSWHGPPSARQLFVNISTWCVAPSHRGPLAKQLYDRAGARGDAVNTNLSAASHTLRTLDKLGFQPWTSGQFVAVAPRRRTQRAGVLTGAAALKTLPDHERGIFEDHGDGRFLPVALDCDGAILPLLLLKRRIKGVVPAAQLIYCPDLARLDAHMGALLAGLRRRGCLFLILDANGAKPDLHGKFYPGRAAKFYRGQQPAIDVDHTYSEMLYLGF